MDNNEPQPKLSPFSGPFYELPDGTLRGGSMIFPDGGPTELVEPPFDNEPDN